MDNRIGVCELVSSGSGQGQVAGCCEQGNEPLGCIKCREHLDYLRNCQLLKKDSAAFMFYVSRDHPGGEGPHS